MNYRPTICVDFDGVIHSYTSPWSGAGTIADEPVPGAFDWLAEMLEADDGPLPVIYSSRSKEPEGIKAMREWFAIHGFSRALLDKLDFPTQKPAAFLTIDDRAFCFEGAFPSVGEMMAFKPWNKLRERRESAKHPRFLYLHEGCDAWLPLDSCDLVNGYFDSLSDGEAATLRVKRVDMTNAEFAAMPEAG